MISTTNLANATNLSEVTKAEPCPICGKPDWCHRLNGGNLIGCQRPELAGQSSRDYVQTKETFGADGKCYWALKSSQDEYRERKKLERKEQRQREIVNRETWKYPVLTIDDSGTYKESTKHSWYKVRETYEDGKNYFQYGYRNGEKGSIRKNELSQGEFIGLHINAPLKLFHLLNNKIPVSFFEYIAILEGERCVDIFREKSGIKFKDDTCISDSFLALTSIGGATNLSEQDIEMFQKIAQNSPNTPIVLSPDFDQKGYEHIRIIYESLKGLSNPILVVDWSKLPKTPENKFDMADYLEKFKSDLETKSAQEFIEALVVTPDKFDWGKFNSTNTKVSASKYQIETLASAIETLELGADIEYLIDDLLPTGSSVVITAQPKTGKTVFSLDLLASVYTGEKFMGKETKQTKVLYLNGDQTKRGFVQQAKDRWEDISEGLLFVQDWKADNDGLDLLVDWCKASPGSLIVLDSIRACICQPLNISQNEEGVGYKIKEIVDKVSAFGCSIIFVHHDSKNKENRGTHKASGHSSITSMVDIIWHLDKDVQSNRKLSVLGSRLTDEVTISYSLDDSGKCQPIDDEPESEDQPTNSTSPLERIIKSVLTARDSKLTTQEVADSVGATKQGVTKALKNATWVRTEMKGKTRVYWVEQPIDNRQPTTNTLGGNQLSM